MYKIDFYTIKQYSGTVSYDNTADFMHNVSDMMLDASIVSFEAYYPNGSLMKAFVNENARPITKHCPLEKSWVGTKSNTAKELRQNGE